MPYSMSRAEDSGATNQLRKLKSMIFSYCDRVDDRALDTKIRSGINVDAKP